jgi:tetratricopeptide (TPR) repeat protein
LSCAVLFERYLPCGVLALCCNAFRFQDAYEGYGAALRIDENNISMTSKLLCNRAIAALKVRKRLPYFEPFNAKNDHSTRTGSGQTCPGQLKKVMRFLFLQLQRFEHAVQDASAALFFNPQYAKAYATRAAAHVELDRYVEAEKDYEHAIELEPWEREHGRQLSQVKKQLSQQREKDGGDKDTAKAKGKAAKK